MSVEIGSLVVKGRFGQPEKQGLDEAELAARLEDLRADILADIRAEIARIERRRMER